MSGQSSAHLAPAQSRLVLPCLCGLVLANASCGDAQAAEPATLAASYRLASATHKHDGARAMAIALQLGEPHPRRSWRTEIAAGALTAQDGSIPFLSIGPAWHRPLPAPKLFVEFGISPTLIRRTVVNGRTLGGKFHFTSSAALGMRLGPQGSSVSLRIQHMSNGGLHDDNPGIDLFGLDFSFRMGGTAARRASLPTLAQVNPRLAVTRYDTGK
jgi:hypothetical protein